MLQYSGFENNFPQSIRIAAVAVFFGLTAVSPAKAANTVLGTDQIKRLLLNQTIKQVDDQYYAFYAGGGRVKALYVNAVESGRWSVSQNQVCHKWETWNKGQTACFYVIRGQQGAYRFQDVNSSDGFNFVLKSGNHQGL